MKKLLNKIDETDDVAWKEGSEQRKSVCTEENTELVQTILSQDDQVVSMFACNQPAKCIPNVAGMHDVL